MSLLLGGLITLSVTALVQILIIPWVQRRSRRIERWETDVIELQRLLDEELKEALGLLGFALRRVRRFSAELAEAKTSGTDVTKIEADLDRAEKVAMESWLNSGAMLTRASNLAARTTLVRRSAPVWWDLRQVLKAMDRLHTELCPDEMGNLRGFPEDYFRETYYALRPACETASETLGRVSETMHPPGPIPCSAQRHGYDARAIQWRNPLRRNNFAVMPGERRHPRGSSGLAASPLTVGASGERPQRLDLGPS